MLVLAPGSSGRGSCSALAGKLIGRRPDGSTSPNSTLAIASPPLAPGYQASSSAPTLPAQGMSTGLPVSNTTMVCGLAAATASISASWPSPKVSWVSMPSDAHCSANTIATSASLASAAAAAGSEPVS